MPLITYDYIPRPFLKKGKLDAIYQSKVPIRLSAYHRMYPYLVECIVDSGADFNLFPGHIADSLGISMRKGQKTEHIGIGNVGIIAYRHPVKIFLEGYSFSTEIDFSYDHKIPLLGRYGFFRYFKAVNFNEAILRLELTY